MANEIEIYCARGDWNCEACSIQQMLGKSNAYGECPENMRKDIELTRELQRYDTVKVGVATARLASEVGRVLGIESHDPQVTEITAEAIKRYGVDETYNNPETVAEIIIQKQNIGP